jgi:hypothetical protein
VLVKQRKKRIIRMSSMTSNLDDIKNPMSSKKIEIMERKNKKESIQKISYKEKT